MMRFLRWLITPGPTPLTVGAAFLLGNTSGRFSGDPLWYGTLAAVVIGVLWAVADSTVRALVSKRRARS